MSENPGTVNLGHSSSQILLLAQQQQGGWRLPPAWAHMHLWCPPRPSWQPQLLEQPELRVLEQRGESRGCSSSMEITNALGKLPDSISGARQGQHVGRGASGGSEAQPKDCSPSPALGMEPRFSTQRPPLASVTARQSVPDSSFCSCFLWH